MKAIVYKGPEKIAIENVAVPEAGPGEVLIKISFGGICGTDLHIYMGKHPRAKPELILGHEVSGTVVFDSVGFSRGSKVTVRPLISCGTCAPCAKGLSHVCQTLRLFGIDQAGGFAEYMKVPSDVVHALPDDTDLRLGALVEPLAVGVHAVSRSECSEDAKALVFGAGTIGLVTAIALSLLKTQDVLIVEQNEFRRKLAESLGFKTVSPQINDVKDTIVDWSGGRGADVVFDCAAHPNISSVLANLTAVRGKIVTVGSYTDPAPFDFQTLMFREQNLVGTRVYEAGDFDRAISLLATGFPFERLITNVYSVDEAQKGFDLLTRRGDAIKVMYSF